MVIRACQTLIRGMKRDEKTGSTHLTMCLYVGSDQALKLEAICLLYMAELRRAVDSLDGRQGQPESPGVLAHPAFFITVKPLSKLTASRIAVCAAGSAVSMRTQKKIRDRTGGSTCPLVVEKSNRRRVCLSLGQRLTQ